MERKEGTLFHNETRMCLVDLPGTYSLTAHSLEEQVARDFIIHEHPDIIVMVTDASSLEHNLYLLAELLILRVPVVLALNMLDVAEAQVIQIEPHVLEAALGLPVVPMVATRNQGLAEIVAAIGHLACNPDTFQPVRPQIAAPHRRELDQLKEMVAGQVPAPFDPDWVALKLLERDAEITRKAKGWAGKLVWPRIEALLSAHEDGQGEGGLAHTLAAQVSPATALAFLTVTMLFIPCLATVAVMRQETGS